MLIADGDLFRLKENYLHLDKGTVCKCLEDADLDSEFCILAATPSGSMLIPVECITYYSSKLEVDDESTQ